MKTKRQEPRYKSVMLVDDNQIDNYINEMIIKGSGFAENVFSYSGAMSSLDFFKNIRAIHKLSNELLPTYLFLDINMPVLDGFQFLDEFAEFSPLLKQEIKIVILTTSANPIDIKKAAKYGEVVKFLRKPLTEEDLSRLN
ncbi:MAG: response regulator [Bacteroidia bacterium]